MKVRAMEIKFGST